VIPYLIAGAVGAWIAGKSKPHTDSKKRELIGPKSGLTYRVDEFPAQGVVMVHGPRAVGVFERKPNGPGFRWLRGNGDKRVLAWMIRDFS
jgi:hypothetical protein